VPEGSDVKTPQVLRKNFVQVKGYQVDGGPSDFIRADWPTLQQFIEAGTHTLTPHPNAVPLDEESAALRFDPVSGGVIVTAPTLFTADTITVDPGDDTSKLDDGRELPPVAGENTWQAKARNIVNTFKRRRKMLHELNEQITALASTDGDVAQFESDKALNNLDGKPELKMPTDLAKRKENLASMRERSKLLSNAIAMDTEKSVKDLEAKLAAAVQQERDRIQKIVDDKMLRVAEITKDVVELVGSVATRNELTKVVKPQVAGTLPLLNGILASTSISEDSKLLWATILARLPIPSIPEAGEKVTDATATPSRATLSLSVSSPQAQATKPTGNKFTVNGV